ncbi:hypothetical protein HYS94_04620 [Candidatus Daviesbacteria bacterium]|nr:hypothetical protein [Candidatus Daviesbacteria bacterium]
MSKTKAIIGIIVILILTGLVIYFRPQFISQADKSTTSQPNNDPTSSTPTVSGSATSSQKKYNQTSPNTTEDFSAEIEKDLNELEKSLNEADSSLDDSDLTF